MTVKIIQLIHVKADHLIVLDSDGAIWNGWYGLNPDFPDLWDWSTLNGPWDPLE